MHRSRDEVAFIPAPYFLILLPGFKKTFSAGFFANKRFGNGVFGFESVLSILLVALVLVFIVWPIGEVILKSFFPTSGFSLEIYQDLLTNQTGLITDSLFCALLSTVLTISIALAISLYLTFCQVPFKKVIVAGLMLTMISPPFVSSLAYIMLFGRRGWIIYRFFDVSWNPYGMHGVVMMQVLGNVSLATLLITGALRILDGKVLDASRDLGGSVRRTILRMALPLSSSGIVAAAFIVFIKCLADFGTPIIIGGRFTLLATEAYLAVIGRGDMPLASAISVLILLPSLAAFFFYRRYLVQTGGETVELRTGKKWEPALHIRGGWRRLLGVVTWTILGVMLLQYGAIFLGAFTDYRQGHFVFTVEHIQAIRLGKMTSFFRSLQYAFVAAFVGSLLGMILSYQIERKRFPLAGWMDFLVTLPYIMPGPFFGIGYILAFHSPPLLLTGTGAIVVLNCMFRQLPISTKATSATLMRINPQTEDASRDLGASRLRTVFCIVMPLLKPAFLVSFINTFTTTMTTVGAIIFLVTPGAKVATVELFNVLRDGDYGQGAVLASMIIAATLVINLAFARVLLGEKT
jgi:iron(III) transport system permease protein